MCTVCLFCDVVLPADLMAEAQLLRGELEDRNRRLQDQLFTGGSTLGSILRQSGMSGSYCHLAFIRLVTCGNQTNYP